MFKVNTNGTSYSLLRIFSSSYDAKLPWASLVQLSSGKLYGTTRSGQLDATVFTIGTNGSGYNILYTFNATGGDGAIPYAGPLLGIDGALYGTTAGGGTYASGAIYRVATNGAGYQILHHFAPTTADGQDPGFGKLLQGQDGTLYGATAYGGLYNAGTIYKLSPDGTGYSVLYNFRTNGIDGQLPFGALLQGADGMLYGTTAQGGSNGMGTVFTMSTNGSGYASYAAVANPYTGLIQDADGWLYGVGDPTPVTNGVVFKINTNGSGLTILHAFANTDSTGDGARPDGRLLLGNDSVLYGTTELGGASGHGTVFKMNRDGSGYTQLHSFSAFPGDGSYAYGGLIQGSDGVLYGQTYEGGAAGRGTVFSIKTDGTGYAVWYSFGAAPDGLRTWAGPLAQGADGSLYGTTSQGGDMNKGILFRLLIPPQFGPVVGRADKNVDLSLTGLGTHPCTVEASDDLITWVALTNFSFPSGTMPLSDLSATNYPRRFYRTVWSP